MTRRILLSTFFILSTLGPAASQTKSPAQEAKPALVAAKLDIKAQLQLRDLQYKQTRVLLQMQELRRQSDLIDSEINGLITTLAKDQKIDLTKYIFDLDKLEFVERPAAK